MERWTAAVRAGRTSISSGPFLRLAVDGQEPGDVIRMGSPGSLEVTARAQAAQPVISDVELVVDGRIVAAVERPSGTMDLEITERVPVERGTWIAARSRSRHVIGSAFTTSMAAHTSPVYVEVAGRPLIPRLDDAAVVEQVILGARSWVADLAAIADPSERRRMLAFFDASLERLRERLTRLPA